MYLNILAISNFMYILWDETKLIYAGLTPNDFFGITSHVNHLTRSMICRVSTYIRLVVKLIFQFFFSFQLFLSFALKDFFYCFCIQFIQLLKGKWSRLHVNHGYDSFWNTISFTSKLLRMNQRTDKITFV